MLPIQFFKLSFVEMLNSILVNLQSLITIIFWVTCSEIIVLLFLFKTFVFCSYSTL